MGVGDLVVSVSGRAGGRTVWNPRNTVLCPRRSRPLPEVRPGTPVGGCLALTTRDGGRAARTDRVSSAASSLEVPRHSYLDESPVTHRPPNALPVSPLSVPDVRVRATRMGGFAIVDRDSRNTRISVPGVVLGPVP